jgi:DNA segregation ATPase FtsK/SpoIIIE-like protein
VGCFFSPFCAMLKVANLRHRRDFKWQARALREGEIAMSDKPSDDKERPRSSIFGSKRSEDKEEEKKTDERPSPFGGKPASGIFGKPAASEPSKPSSTSTFGRPAQMPPKPSTTTGSTPKAESKPASSGSGSGSGSTFGSRSGTGVFGAAKPADPAPPKPESPPKPSTPKPEEKKPGGLFGGFGRGGGKPEEKKEPPKPASSAAPARIGSGTTAAPKAEPPSRSAAPAKKPADVEQPKRGFPNLGALFGRGKKEEEDKPAKPADAPKIGTGKPAPAEAPKPGGSPFSRLQGEKPSEPPKDQPKPATATGATPRFGAAAATPPKADPKKDDKKPEQPAKGGFFSRFRRGGAAKPESGASAAPLKTPAPIDGKRGGSSIPGAPPARGEKQAKPLEGQTHVTVKNVGLSLDQKLDMIGWLLIVTGVVMIFGFIQPDEGTFTKAIVDIFGALFGYGRYVLPLPCLAVGGWLLVRYFKENPFLTFDALQMTGAVLLFLSIVTGLHTIELIDKIVYDWDELIAVSARAVDLMQGGGWVGDRLYMILIRLTGEFGVPVVLAITTFIGTLWLFELSLAEITTYIKSSFQIFGARTRRIRESWRAWRQTVAARRAAQAAARAQVRAQREAAKLAAQAQAQPKPAAGLPAAATLAHTADLPEQPVPATVGAEQTPPARKAAFRTSVVVPAVAVAQPPSEETPLPAPAIAKPAPLGARSTPVQTAAQPAAQPTAFSVPVAEASPTAAPEKPAEKSKTGVFGGVFGGKPKSEPTPTPEKPAESAPAASTAPEKPAEKPKTGSFGGIFGGGKPKSEPTPTPEKPAESAPAASPAPEKPAEKPKTGSFSGIFGGGKPKSEPTPTPEKPAESAPAASTAPEKPAEKPKTGSFGGIFGGGKPKSEPAPDAPTVATPAATAPVDTPEAAPEKPAEKPKTGSFGGVFGGGKPKSEPAPDAPTVSTPTATAPVDTPEAAPEKPAEKPKTGSFGGIFGGGKPKSEPAPDAPTVATPAATAPVDSEPPDLSVTQPTRATGAFKTPTPAPKPGSGIFGSKPKPAEPEPADDAEDEAMPVAKAPPPPAKPASGIFGSKPSSSPFGSPSAFRPAPKPTSEQPAVRAPQPDDAADDLEDRLDDEDAAHSAPLTPERVPTSAPAPRIFGSFGGAKPTEKPAESSVGTPVAAAAPLSAAELPPMQHLPGDTTWQMPDYRELLQSGSAQTITEEMLAERRRLIEETLEAFGAPGRVVETNVGPTITQFGVEPGYLNSRGKQTRIKVNQIAKLDADLALALAARSIRIEAPVPGKGYVGIEVPNPETSLVGLRDIIGSSTFNQMRSRLRVALGKSIDGAAVVSDLTQMPHMLIAGTTGSGKSVCVNAVIACLLLQNSPDDLKLIMVDPKRVELTGYNGIPHLVSPVVVDLERVTGVLKWVTREMDDRYKKFAASGARNITDYNSKIGATEPRMPYLVVIIDELADLMMLAPDETEKQLTRLAQMARATGIHLIISTQRPSVDVVTGLIKANFPARISFAVASSVDSRVILDQPGAEKLLGRGDMLYQAPDAAAPIRVQGVYVSDAELKQITDFWKAAQKERGTPLSSVSFDHAPDKPTAKLTKPGESAPFQPRTERFGSSSPFGTPKFAPPRPQPSPDDDAFFAAVRGDAAEDEAVDDALYEKAVELYRQNNGKISVMMLQTRLKVGYRHAESIYKLMRERGVVKNTDSGDDNADA